MAYTEDKKSTGLDLLTWAQLANDDIITVGDASDSGRLKGVLKSQIQAQIDAKQDALGYAAENTGNKSTDGTMAGNSDTLFPSQKATRTFAEAKKAEANTYSDGLITALKDGVATQGNTLQKLYNLILGADAEDYVANTAARDAYNIPQLPFTLFVIDDGDSKWAKYQATTTGVGATFVKISDPDLLNAVMSASAIKASYESNADTNAFTNALLSKLNAIEALADVTDAGNVGSSIHGASDKATPVDADKIAIINSVGNVLNTVSLTNFKAFLKTYFDTLYTGGGGSAAREVISATLSGTQTNYSISGVSTDISVTTELRVAFTSGSFIWQSIDTTSWEDGKYLTIVNDTVSDASGARFFLVENQEGASGTKFRYAFNGVPPIIMPGDSITWKLNTTDGFLDFVSSSCFGADAANGFTAYSDFVGGPAIASGGAANGLGPFAGIQGNGSSAYTSTFQASPVNAFGVLEISTHTNSTGAFFVGSSNVAMMRGGVGAALFLTRATPSTALSDGSNTYTLIAGFNDAQFGAPTDAVQWKYDQSAATVWRTSTISNSTETVNNQSGFTVSITTMPYLGIFCNGNWTNIEFFYSVDGQTWVIGNAHTTNIPTGSSRALGFGIRIQKSVGTTARLAAIDLMGVRTMHIRA